MAGSSCPIEVMKRVVNDMGCRELTICYGMTETSPVVSSNTPDVNDPRSVGMPLAGVEILIV